jgi:hypothetical protein
MNGPHPTSLLGVVIKEPSDTPGLIVANGRQYSFRLEGVWQSAVAPVINQSVELHLDGNGGIAAIRVVAGANNARKAVERLTDLAREHGPGVAERAQAAATTLKQRMALYPLIAACVLVLAWFALASVSGVSYDTGGLSLWDISSLDMNSIAKLRLKEHGALSLLGLLCLAGPFAAAFASKRLTLLAGALPLVFVVFTVIRIFVNANNYFATQAAREWAAGMFGRQASLGDIEQQAIRMAMEDVLHAASLGSGFYLIVAISAYLAWRSWRAFAAFPQENS